MRKLRLCAQRPRLPGMSSQAGHIKVARGVETSDDVLHRRIGLDDVRGKDHQPSVVATSADQRLDFWTSW